MYEKALKAKALKANDKWFDGHYNVANLYMDIGPEGESSAIEHFKRAIEVGRMIRALSITCL